MRKKPLTQTDIERSFSACYPFLEVYIMAYSLYLVPSFHDDWEAAWYALTEAEVADGCYPDKIPADVARRGARRNSLFYLGRPVWHTAFLVRSADSKPVFYPHNCI